MGEGREIVGGGGGERERVRNSNAPVYFLPLFMIDHCQINIVNRNRMATSKEEFPLTGRQGNTEGKK